MSIFATLLEPVWGLNEEMVRPLIVAAESQDNNKIEKAISSLEAMLASTSAKQFPYYAKYRGFESEIKAKIAVLKAIVSGQQSDWEVAQSAYKEVKNAMDQLAGSCRDNEDVPKILFHADAEHAGKLAALCLGQIEGKKAEAAKQMFQEEATRLIDRVGPSYGCGDFTYWPVFPESRQDIGAIKRLAEDGYSRSSGTIYLVWRGKDGKIWHRGLISSNYYIDTKAIQLEEDSVVVKVVVDNYDGSKREESFRIPLAELDLGD